MYFSDGSRPLLYLSVLMCECVGVVLGAIRSDREFELAVVCEIQLDFCFFLSEPAWSFNQHYGQNMFK